MADGPVSRRDFVKATVAAAAATALGVGALSTVLPILDGSSPATTSPIIRRPSPGGPPTPVRVADLAGDPVVVLTAEWNYLPAIVYKVRVATLQASALFRGYNTGQYAIAHPTEPDLAILAYDGKCTHLGCTVGFNKTLGASVDVRDYDGDDVPDGRVLCPCHQAQFDVFDLAKNMPGTPAPRPLDAMVIQLGPELDGSPTIEAVRRIRQDEYRGADRDGLGASFRLAS